MGLSDYVIWAVLKKNNDGGFWGITLPFKGDLYIWLTIRRLVNYEWH